MIVAWTFDINLPNNVYSGCWNISVWMVAHLQNCPQNIHKSARWTGAIILYASILWTCVCTKTKFQQYMRCSRAVRQLITLLCFVIIYALCFSRLGWEGSVCPVFHLISKWNRLTNVRMINLHQKGNECCSIYQCHIS